MPSGFTESDAEEAALGWLETLGYTVRRGPEIAYTVDGGERTDPGYHDTILQNRLHRALTRLNPGLRRRLQYSTLTGNCCESKHRTCSPEIARCTACSSMASMSNTRGRTGRLPAPRRRSSISTGPSKTTAWRSTNSPSSRGSKAAAPIL